MSVIHITLEGRRSTTNQFINEDKHLRLGMLSGLDVAVDGHAPSLVADDLDVAVEPINHGCQLGSEDENVYAAELSERVQSVCDVLDEDSSLSIHDETIFDIDSRATLQPQFSQTRYSYNYGVLTTGHEGGDGAYAYQCQRSFIQDGLAALVDQLRSTRETDSRDLAPDVLGHTRYDVGLDRQRALGQLHAHVPQGAQVLHVYGQVVDGDVVGGLLGVSPSQYRVSRGVQDLLRVGSGKFGRERNVERVVNGGVGGG